MPLDFEKLLKNSGGDESVLKSLYLTEVGKKEKDMNRSEWEELQKKFAKRYGGSSGGFNFGGSGGETGGESGGQKKTVAGKIFGGISKAIGKTADITGDIYSSQLGQYTDDRNFDAVRESLGLIEKNGINVKKILKDIISKSYTQILDQLKQESELLDQINRKTSLTGELSEKVREDFVQASITAAKYGKTVKDIGDFYTFLVEQTGKFNLINRKTVEEALPLVNAFDMTMGELGRTIGTFQDVGIGANNTIKLLGEAGIRSTSLGLSGKKIIDGIRENIGLLNNYTFKNGIRGLEEMVKKSTEFKLNIQSVTKIADDLFSPEKALDMTANLQMIGGALGDFNDPLKMMYNATNNINGIQDSLIKATESLAEYNLEQGRFEVTGLNLRRAKEMAEIFGMSLQDVNKTAIATAERTYAATSLMSKGFQLEDKQMEFLTNLASMEGGEMVIKIPESIAEKIGAPAELALEKLTQGQAQQLLQFQDEITKMNTQTMAEKQLTEVQNIQRDVAVIAQYYKVEGGKVAGGLIKGAMGTKTMTSAKGSISETSAELRGSKRSKTKEETVEFVNNPSWEQLGKVFGINNAVNTTIPTATNTNVPVVTPTNQTNVVNTTNTSTSNINQSTSIITDGVADGLSKALKPFQRSPSLGVTIDKMDLNAIKNISNGIGQKVGDQTSTVTSNVVNTTTDKLDQQLNKTVAVQTEQKTTVQESNQTNNQILTSINKQSDEAKKLQQYFDNTNVNYKENLDVSKKSSEIFQTLFTTQTTNKSFNQSDLLRKDVESNNNVNVTENKLSKSYDNYVERIDILERRLSEKNNTNTTTNTTQQNQNFSLTRTEDLNKNKNTVQNQTNTFFNTTTNKLDESLNKTVALQTDQKKSIQESNQTNNQILTSVNKEIQENRTINNNENKSIVTNKSNINSNTEYSDYFKSLSLSLSQKTNKEFNQNDLLRKNIESNVTENNLSKSYANYVETVDILEKKLSEKNNTNTTTNNTEQNETLRSLVTEDFNQRKNLFENESKLKIDYSKEQSDYATNLFDNLVKQQQNNIVTTSKITEDITRNQSLNYNTNVTPNTISSVTLDNKVLPKKETELFSANVQPVTPKNTVNVTNETNTTNTENKINKNTNDNTPKSIEVVVKTSGNAMDIWANAVASSLRGYGEVPDYFKQQINS